MSFFILVTSSIQLSLSEALALPSRLVSFVRFGQNWRDVEPLNALDRFDAQNEKEYSTFIDQTPFYEYPWLSKMAQMWKAVFSSNDSLSSKIFQSLSCVTKSASFLVTSLISLIARTAFGTNSPTLEAVYLLVKDTNNAMADVKAEWEAEDESNRGSKSLKIVYETPDHHKLIRIPPYMPKNDILKLMSEQEGLQVLEMGARKTIPVDLKLRDGQATPNFEGVSLMFEQPILQDAENKRMAFFEVPADRLLAFVQANRDDIVYIHE